MAETVSADPIVALAVPETLRNPYAAYARLRDSDPVYWSEAVGSWMLTRHADCAAVLRDTKRFASDWRRVGEDVPTPLLSIQALDPPEHTAIRHFMVNAVRTVDRPALHEAVTERVRARIAVLRGAGTFDAVRDLAAPVALETIVSVLGVPSPDPEWFLPVSQAIADGMDAGIWPETYEPAVAARARLAELAEGWLSETPGHGLAGYVAEHGPDSGVDRQVLLNSMRAVFHAGFESAGRLLGNGLLALASTPGALARLAEADVSAAVEELIRYDAPVQADSRACVEETRLGGKVIAAGSPVTMLLGAANRDPACFADPDLLDFGRDPNPHLGFGRGAHACLGQSIAMLQARVVFGTLAAECREIQITAEPEHWRNLTLRGLSRLEIRLI